MNCREFEMNMFDYRQRKLNGSQMAESESHLNNCGQCRDAYQFFNAAMLQIDQQKEFKLSADFEMKVLQRVLRNDAQTKVVLLRHHFMQYAAVVFLFISTITAGWFAGNRLYQSPVEMDSYAQDNFLTEELYLTSSAQIEVEEVLWNNTN